MFPSFSGRVSRKNFFLGLLTLWVSTYVLAFFISFVLARLSETLFYVSAVVLVAVCIFLSLSLNVRRAHDLGYTGFIILLGLLPFVNLILLICFLVMKGDEGDNQYGLSTANQPFRAAFWPSTTDAITQTATPPATRADYLPQFPGGPRTQPPTAPPPAPPPAAV